MNSAPTLADEVSQVAINLVSPLSADLVTSAIDEEVEETFLDLRDALQAATVGRDDIADLRDWACDHLRSTFAVRQAAKLGERIFLNAVRMYGSDPEAGSTVQMAFNTAMSDGQVSIIQSWSCGAITGRIERSH